jgi:iron(III) transport system permease protein
MAVSVVLATALGVLGAWAASTLENAGRLGRFVARVFFVAMVTAIAIPMILHAAAWEATAGKFGWLPLTQTGSRSYQGLSGSFGGAVACGWIHGLAGVSLIALATWYGVRRIPAAMVQHSQLEVGPIASWWRIRLPIALPWLLMGMLATAALAATEMTVVDLYGLRTLADEFYLFYAADPNATSIVMTCVIPLGLGAAVVGLHRWAGRRAVAVRAAASENLSLEERLSRPVEAIACLIAIVVAAIVLVVPLAGLVVKVGHQVVVTEGARTVSWSLSQCLSVLASAPRTFSAEYQWTIVLAVMTGLAAVALAWPLAALARMNRRLELFVDFATIAIVLVPGPIVGLAVVRLFQLPLPGFRDLYQATLIPTVMALLVRAGAVAYWILRTGYRGVDDDLLAAARLDSGWLVRLWVIDRKMLSRSLLAAMLAAAIVASGDVPATLPVAPPGVTTVGTRLFGLLHSGARYQEAALALWYVGSIVVIAAGWVRCSRPRHATL